MRKRVTNNGASVDALDQIGTVFSVLVGTVSCSYSAYSHDSDECSEELHVESAVVYVDNELLGCAFYV